MKKANHFEEGNQSLQLRYGIRKMKLGTASILLSASFLALGLAQGVKADELTEVTQAVALADKVEPAVTPTSTEAAVQPASENNNMLSETKASSDYLESQPVSDLAPVASEDLSADQSTSQNQVAVFSTQEKTVTPTTPAIPENTMRVHFQKLPSENVDSLGLWTWDDVETPSSKLGSWPTGATNFSQAKQDNFGYYLDVKMAENKRSKISLLINNVAGDNLTGDKVIDLLSPAMNEVWFDDRYQLHTAEPMPANTVRINYYRTDGNYQQKSLWFWGDVKQGPTSWPDGEDFTKEGKYGRYVDVTLADAAKMLGFLLLDESKSGDAVKIQPQDYTFADLQRTRQLFVRDDDPTVYTNPYFVKDVRVVGAQHVSPSDIELRLTTLEAIKKEALLKDLSVTDKSGASLVIQDIILDVPAKKVILKGDFNQTGMPYTVSYGRDQFKTGMNWRLKDAFYSYDGELGARVSQAGKQVDVTLWAPSADKVELVVYDKNHQETVVGTVPLTKGIRGEWTGQLTPQNALGIQDYRGYYYHYRITRGEASVLVLDPYAKSLAAWNSEDAGKGPAYKVAKAAFVDLSDYGPKDLDYAQIPQFKKREDAIIYEAHVRDFTSDQSISSELNHQFGTFAAFAERLDYLKDLGVTHIQLLPVLSYYFVNELKNAERLDTYASSNSNYNWGYDPQNYFALTGMYSQDPTDPGKRIEEFKQLVHAIHQRGMGVILDVVYNHTAQTAIFEDIEPNYYHFMDADGTPRTSFGGGRLGTMHYMSRRVLIDSIRHLVKEYKVDGFRFDMMGDHDAKSIEMAFNEAKALNPKIIMLGEGWVTYAGDENQPVQPADQSWMKATDTVAVFSDDVRNTLKSGYPNEGTPAFITGGKRNIETVFNNIKAQPTNFEADSPGDVIQYIAAHDNLTLFDIIAQSIKKDPAVPANDKEIHRRLRLGNLIVLTAQGTPFLHSGQEYGRTKQFRHPDYRYPVSDDKVPNKAHLLTNADGSPFDYPYFIHDSYDSSDSVNRFDWQKARNVDKFPENTKSQAYTKALIALRRSTDAFRLPTKAAVNQKVTLISRPGKSGIATEDLVLAYQTVASNGDIYAVFVNADTKTRSFDISDYPHLAQAEILADGEMVDLKGLKAAKGVSLSRHLVTLDALTATILRVRKTPQEQPNQSEEFPKEQSHKKDNPVLNPKNNNLTDTPEFKELRISQKTAQPVFPESSHKGSSQEYQAKSLPKTGSQETPLSVVVGFGFLLTSFVFGKKRKNES